jgi:hypothetical protein
LVLYFHEKGVSEAIDTIRFSVLVNVEKWAISASARQPIPIDFSDNHSANKILPIHAFLVTSAISAAEDSQAALADAEV